MEAEKPVPEKSPSGTAQAKAPLFLPDSANLDTDPIPAIGYALENVVRKGARLYGRIRLGDFDSTNKFERAYLFAWRISCEELCELLRSVAPWMDDSKASPFERWSVKVATELIRIGSFFHLLECETIEGWELERLNEPEQQKKFADLLTKVASRVDELAAVWRTIDLTKPVPEGPKEEVILTPTVPPELETGHAALDSAASGLLMPSSISVTSERARCRGDGRRLRRTQSRRLPRSKLGEFCRLASVRIISMACR